MFVHTTILINTGTRSPFVIIAVEEYVPDYDYYKHCLDNVWIDHTGIHSAMVSHNYLNNLYRV